VVGITSNPIITNTGTPQGCFLSPLFFSIYTNRITSSQSNITVIKHADETCVIGCFGKQSDLNIYFDKINIIFKQCDDLNIILLNFSKIQEIMFSIQPAKPHTPTLVLNGTNILLFDKVQYFGVLVDHNLRFHEHVKLVVATVSRRMYIVKNVVYLSSKPLANILFKGFIVSRIAYCLPIISTCIYASAERLSKRCSKIAQNLELSI